MYIAYIEEAFIRVRWNQFPNWAKDSTIQIWLLRPSGALIWKRAEGTS